ncbi:unnamed protein product [Ceutorhynchus assimilis]|uniref:Uncharacterized protein n=1 Tax=Ceutorhynchus assimilis TaxID=467358 RepID=A0A9P0DRH0_9CUCU|nr:unnamed protein product [Ceutorhynchus assimilis]
MLSAGRNGDFGSHLAAVYDFLPYLSAAGRNLYSKWLPVYLSDIERLRQQVPYIYNFLASGNFVVKKTNEKRFNCVASDMALEQFISRDCKSFRHYWIFAETICSTSVDESMTQSELTRRKEVNSLQKTNECNVLAVMNTTESDWCNPFDINHVPSSLINICTGKEVHSDIEQSLNNFINQSQNNKEVFWKGVDNLNFWKPKSRNKVLTFKEGNVKENPKKGNPIIGSELMFPRILCAAQRNEIDLTTILSHELTLVPTSLFYDDGSMRKITKSDLAKKIEGESKATVDCTTVQSLMVDGMVTIQEIIEKEMITFNDLNLLTFDHPYNSQRDETMNLAA